MWSSTITRFIGFGGADFSVVWVLDDDDEEEDVCFCMSDVAFETFVLGLQSVGSFGDGLVALCIVGLECKEW